MLHHSILIKSTGAGTNFSISNLSASVFKLAKFVFSAKLEVSTLLHFYQHGLSSFEIIFWNSLAILIPPDFQMSNPCRFTKAINFT